MYLVVYGVLLAAYIGTLYHLASRGDGAGGARGVAPGRAQPLPAE
jgi:hypothetical protein